MKMRIGHGYDAHRLVSDRRLVLGGVEIPFKKGLLGHSDADVLIHAIADAILGAAALGDIGCSFPDTDPKLLNADSVEILKKVVKTAEKKGLRIGNIDATVVAQAPRLSPYIGKMRANIATACNVEVSEVNVKATTEEHLGFTGAGDGIAAHAVCLLVNRE